MPTVFTDARLNFDGAIGDVDRLLQLHDELSGASAGRPPMDLEVLKRSAVILTVTAWESYIEDTLRDVFKARLKQAKEPADVASAFNATAQYAWEQARQAPDPRWISNWAGSAWKERIAERFEAEIDALNTPSSRNIAKLFRRYADVDVASAWSWQRTSVERATQRLDQLIKLRGELVHRGRRFFDLTQSVRKKDATGGMNLVKQLVSRTDEALGRSPQSI